METLFANVREACSRPVWSKGVELARANGVSEAQRLDDEILLRVTCASQVVQPTVSLYPSDGDWACDCGSDDDPCAHVAGAVIALWQAQREGRTLSRTASKGEVGYRLWAKQGLCLDRVIRRGGRVLPLNTSIAVASRDGGVAVTETDIKIERIVSAAGKGPLPRHGIAALLAALSRCDDVQFDGRPAEIGDDRAGLLALVEDCAEGVRVRVMPDPAIERVLDNGAVIRKGRLHAVVDPGLGAGLLEALKRGRVFGPSDFGELVSELLPRLEERLPVNITATKLPRRGDARPRLQVVTERLGRHLKALATLVYGDPPVLRIDGEHVRHLGGAVPKRRPKDEDRLRALLQRELGMQPGMALEFDPEAAIGFAGRLRNFAEESGVSVQMNACASFYRTGALHPRLQVSESAGSFDLDIAFETEVESGTPTGRGRATGQSVLDAYARDEPLVPLMEGGFAPLPVDWLRRYGSKIRDLLEARAMNPAGSLPRAVAVDVAELCDEAGVDVPRGIRALAEQLRDGKRTASLALPEDLDAELRDYQRDGIAWLQRLFEAGLGALLADDMGLGKTLQALCVLRGRCLVVAPTSVLPNWRSEIKRFRPSTSVCSYHGAKRRLEAGAEVTLTTYALLRIDGALLAQEPWDVVVLDEAQNIKNPSSQAACAARRLQARFRLALTGTPIENRLEDLWSQFAFLNPGLLGSQSGFRDRYVRPMVAGDLGVAADLRRRIRPFILRRRKDEVARELPPRIEVVSWCELTPTEQDIYGAIEASTRAEVLRKLQASGNVIEALEALLRLRQAACHTGLLPGHEAARGQRSSKVELLLDHLETATAEGHRSLVFSQWTSLLDLVEGAIAESDLSMIRLDGSTRDREGVVNAFQAEDGPPVMLVSLKAGGTGLNLTAADHVFLLDPWWNPAVENQAADRAHRIGQTRPVIVHRLIARETIEEGIIALQERKRALAAAAVEGVGGVGGVGAGVDGLSREDLMALLQP